MKNKDKNSIHYTKKRSKEALKGATLLFLVHEEIPTEIYVNKNTLYAKTHIG